MEFNKVTPGIVIQRFNGDSCVSQDFIASDIPWYENPQGELLRDEPKWHYFPLEMTQPAPDSNGPPLSESPLKALDSIASDIDQVLSGESDGNKDTPDGWQLIVEKLRSIRFQIFRYHLTVKFLLASDVFEALEHIFSDETKEHLKRLQSLVEMMDKGKTELDCTEE